MYVECEWCGKIFYKRKKDKRYSGDYCSQECITARDVNNYKVRYIRENKVFRLIHYENKNDVTYACRTCGEKYNSNSTNAIRRKTCANCIKARKEKEAEMKSHLKELKHQYAEYSKKLERLTKQIESNYQKKITQEDREKEHKERVRAERKRRELIREKRIKNNGRIDKDITLSKLYERDKGICYICGYLCDYDNYRLDESGNFIAGENYPSIDHVIPLSKGGTHTWDNIKLAHRSCNTIKFNRPPIKKS